VEQNRIPKYESTTIPNLLLTKALKIYDGEKTASSTNFVGKSGGYLSAKN
jgi:hypothetical protein